MIRRDQEGAHELLLHRINEGRPPCLRSHSLLDTPAHLAPTRQTAGQGLGLRGNQILGLEKPPTNNDSDCACGVPRVLRSAWSMLRTSPVNVQCEC